MKKSKLLILASSIGLTTLVVGGVCALVTNIKTSHKTDPQASLKNCGAVPGSPDITDQDVMNYRQQLDDKIASAIY
jgi:hypothetical protein